MTSKKTITPDYDALAPKYEAMFRNIDRMQWDIGQQLVEDGIEADGQMQRLSATIGREAKTLKTYRQVYVNFHEWWPDGRPSNISHGVLEQLIRVPDDKVWKEFFRKYPLKPTRTLAEIFINEHLSAKLGKRSRRSIDTQNVKVGGVFFRISVTQDGRGRIDLEGASQVGTPSLSEVKDNIWTLEFAE
jgi:hypothetical protein